MNHPRKQFFLGPLCLPSNIWYAPLAGCSDYPFRRMTARHKPGLMFCEMVKMEPLVRGIPETLRMLDYSEEMRPIGGQICGSKPELAGAAARIVQDKGFDVVDLNCGCPVDKVTKDGSGSGLLKNPDKIGEIISNMVAAVDIPVTVKIRLGWDEASINAIDIVRVARQAGAKAITIHARTRQQAYKGPARWDFIKECKKEAGSLIVIGNGDIMTPQDALRMLSYTGCDGVLVARGTMGQPWIVEDIFRLHEGLPLIQRTLEDFRNALLEHLDISASYKSERGALIDMRRVCCWYLKKVSGAREFRMKASHAASLAEVKELIQNLELKEQSGEVDEEVGVACDC